jgi:hypothetical protein
VAVLLGGGPGCHSVLNPVEPGPKEFKQEIQEIPACCRNRVYIFFLQGVDPFDCCNLEGLRDHVQAQGFIKTWFGYFTHHTGYFEKEIIRIHEEDPEARFVLVGFSFGANAIRDLANRLYERDITVDLLFYLGGNTLDDSPRSRPPNVLRVVNILAVGCIWNGAQIEGAENYQLTDVWHFGSPAHPRSTEMLDRELAVIAQRVPIIQVVPAPLPDTSPVPRPLAPPAGQQLPQPRPAPPADQQLPQPRPVPTQAGVQSRPGPGWDFLQPDGVEGVRGSAPAHLAPLALPATAKER